MAESKPTGQPGAMRPGEFVALSQNKSVTFALDKVTPPSNLYVGVDDTLQVLVWNSQANATLTIRTRLLRADGNIQPSRTQVLPTSNRVINVFTIPLAEGFLLSAEIFPEPTQALKRGQCFAGAQIVRGGPVIGENYDALFADYATTQVPIGWPGGNIRQSVEGPGFIRDVAITQPAAGADWIVTVPTGARWQPIAIRGQFVTAIAAANRSVGLSINDGTAAIYTIRGLVVQAASLTQQYDWNTANVRSSAAELDLHNPIPSTLVLMAGSTIQTVTASIQGADQWSSISMLVQEWIET